MLPGWIERRLGDHLPGGDFSEPRGEAALAAPDSVSWQVFKNPVALFIGGIAAVLLELAEPRVRTGVWDHTSFRTDPLTRMRRTGLAAMVTVYGARSVAERMIAGITRMHGKVSGATPGGAPYAALDPELMDWVQATAAFGFVEAFHAYVRPLSEADKDRFYAEGAPAARLYGASGAPTSRAELEALFEAMRPKLERSDTIFEFLQIVGRTPALPGALAPLQPMMIRAAVDLLPAWARETLGLGAAFDLKSWERWLVRRAGAGAEQVVLTTAPPAQACVRLGLPADYLYR
ncbi:MAG TPA: oxygenase MpaB family protein [Caulobacteraceae bacterium]|nr:oxygenase MpaB family protein [Caulobacteraceae bacterium]